MINGKFSLKFFNMDMHATYICVGSVEVYNLGSVLFLLSTDGIYTNTITQLQIHIHMHIIQKVLK